MGAGEAEAEDRGGERGVARVDGGAGVFFFLDSAGVEVAVAAAAVVDSDSSSTLRLRGLGDVVVFEGETWPRDDDDDEGRGGGTTPEGVVASLELRRMTEDDDAVLLLLLLLETNMKSFSCRRPWKLGSFGGRSVSGVAASSSIL